MRNGKQTKDRKKSKDMGILAKRLPSKIHSEYVQDEGIGCEYGNLPGEKKAKMLKADGLLKDQVRGLLRHGKENARKGRDIARLLGFKNDRLVRLALRELIADGVPIASSVIPPLGYFIANSMDEAANYMRVLKSRLVNDAYRRRDFKVAARTVLQPCQPGLF